MWVTCDDGEQAVDRFTLAFKTDQPFQAAILDLTIPGAMGGEDTIRQLLEIDPQVKAIVASGYSDDPIMSNFGDYGFSGSIAKPYRIEELSDVLSEVIAAS